MAVTKGRAWRLGPARNGESKSPRGDGSNGATRERILDATARLLIDKGFSGTRLSDVAEVAGLRAPGIYYYFPSREDLIEEVVRRGQASAREHVTAALEALPVDASPLSRLHAAIEAHLRSVVELSLYTTAYIRNIGQLPEDIRSRLIAEQADYGKVWKLLFDEAAAFMGVSEETNLLAARMLIFGALNWVPEWWSPKRAPIDDVIALALRMTGGVLSSPPKRKNRR